MTSPLSQDAGFTIELSRLTPIQLLEARSFPCILISEEIGEIIWQKRASAYSGLWKAPMTQAKPYLELAQFALMMEKGFSYLGQLQVDNQLQPLIERFFDAGDEIELFLDFLIWIEQLRGFQAHLKKESDVYTSLLKVQKGQSTLPGALIGIKD
jgi:hypothetical protein